jgi:sugar (pentulose or hexulose) kinase
VTADPPGAHEPLVLGVDLGTSAVKIVAVSPAAGVVGAGTAAYPTFSPIPAQAEQDPADWLRALHEAMIDLDRTIASERPAWRRHVQAVGLAGQLPTLVCLGREGVLGRAITWKDARADRATAALIDSAQRRALYRQTGMPLDGRYLGPMFHHHWRGRRDEVTAVLSAKDYLAFELTGERVTDPSTAAGYGLFDLATGQFSGPLRELWGIRPGVLPVVRPAHSAAGSLQPALAGSLGLAPGIPVSVGAADSVSAAFAMAGLEEGTACVTMGSSTIIIDAVSVPQLDPHVRYLLTPHVAPGWYGREMDLLATGTGYRWLSELLGLAPGMLDQRAAQAPPGAHGLVFTPYLAGGEQGALWNPSLRGSILGLTLQHSASDLARAFLEGVGFEIRRCLDVLAESTPVDNVVVAGHLTQQHTSLQMLADILNRPVQAYSGESPAALGAALGALQLVSLPLPARARAAAVLPRGGYESLYHDYLTRTDAASLV